MLLKKKPTALLIIYSLSFLPNARIKNKNKPLQTISTMLTGGSLSLYPSITPRLVGSVAACIRTIPTQPHNSLKSNLLFFAFIFNLTFYTPSMTEYGNIVK